MMYDTDKQIVERLLIPAMMQAVLVDIQNSNKRNNGIFEPINDLLTLSMKEAVMEITPSRVQKIIRRAKRVSTQALIPLCDKLAGVQYLAVARLAADLAERDVIVVGAESSFARAWDIMARAISLHWDQLEKLDGEAVAIARDMLGVLEREGFYRG